MKHRGKTYIVLMIITIGCKVMGFLRESILAYFFGASNSVDAFKLSESLSSVLLGWMVAFSVAFVPIYSELRTHKSMEDAEKYSRQILVFTGLIAAVFVTVAFFASRVIISIGAPGFPEDKQDLTNQMYRICVFAYLIFAQVSILGSLLNCKDQFFSTGVATLFISVTQIVFIVAAYYMKNPLIMACGLPASMLVRYIFLRIRARIGVIDLCKEYRIFPLSESIRSTAKTAYPLFLSEVVISANELIDNTFASSLPEGSVSVLSYANILSASFHTLIASAILTVFYTAIAKNIAEKDKDGERKELDYTINLLATILIPFALFATVFSRWGINLVYERGAFTAETTTRTAIAFIIYILGIPAISFRNMTVEYYQAYKKTHVPLAMSASNIAINIGLNFLLVHRWGYIGLALATTLSYYALFPLEIILIKKLCPEITFRSRIGQYAKLFLATIIPCAAAWFVIRRVDSFYAAQGFAVRLLLFTGLAGISGGVFCLMASKMKVINLKEILSRITNKAGKSS